MSPVDSLFAHSIIEKADSVEHHVINIYFSPASLKHIFHDVPVIMRLASLLKEIDPQKTSSICSFSYKNIRLRH